MKRLRKHLELSEEQGAVQEIASAIGDRRHRDLLDIIAHLEHTKDWTSAVQLLTMAQQCEYKTPIGVAESTTQIEPLKYREMLFSFFTCNGLEPVNISTREILETLAETENMIDAKNKIGQTVVEAAYTQIQDKDILFFVFDEFESSIEENLRQAAETITIEKLDKMSFSLRNNKYNIEPLWYTGPGVIALSSLETKGTWLPRDQIATVLSVIQVSQSTKEKLTKALDVDQLEQSEVIHPSHTDYRLLISSIIDHDISSLMRLGSRHAVTLLNPLLNSTISVYNNTQSSSDYALVLSQIRAHIKIRSPFSLLHLNQLMESDNPRLSTPAIAAIGNFYSQSAASILVTSICHCKKKEKASLMLTALENISNRLPEVEAIIKDALGSECRNKTRLKSLQKKQSEDTEYYEY
jgi:hypothetical protein